MYRYSRRPVFCIGLECKPCKNAGGVGSGCPDDPKDPLHKAVRAHANTIEYAPALMLLIYIASQAQIASWVMWTMVVATACRVLIVIGIIGTRSLARPNPMRFTGALGTYITGLILAGVVLNMAFV